MQVQITSSATRKMTGREKSWGLEKDLVCGMRGAALCSVQRVLSRRDLVLASDLRELLGSFQSMGSFPGQHLAKGGQGNYKPYEYSTGWR